MAKSEIHAFSSRKKLQGWRFVQVLAINTDDGVDVMYSFMKDGLLENTKVVGITKEDTIPSITDDFLEAFVFENEIHDLFGVNFSDIAIDFGGAFYSLAIDEPMTIISPEQKAAREKAAKVAAALAAKKAKESEAAKGGEE